MVPAKPRWLLSIPDAINQLPPGATSNGVSKVRAAMLPSSSLPRTKLLQPAQEAPPAGPRRRRGDARAWSPAETMS